MLHVFEHDGHAKGAVCYQGVTHGVRYPISSSQLRQPCRSPRVVQLCPPSPMEITPMEITCHETKGCFLVQGLGYMTSTHLITSCSAHLKEHL